MGKSSVGMIDVVDVAMVDVTMRERGDAASYNAGGDETVVDRANSGNSVSWIEASKQRGRWQPHVETPGVARMINETRAEGMKRQQHATGCKPDSVPL